MLLLPLDNLILVQICIFIYLAILIQFEIMLDLFFIVDCFHLIVSDGFPCRYIVSSIPKNRILIGS